MLFDRGITNTQLTDLGTYVRAELEQIDQSVAEAKHKAEQFFAAPAAKP